MFSTNVSVLKAKNPSVYFGYQIQQYYWITCLTVTTISILFKAPTRMAIDFLISSDLMDHSVFDTCRRMVVNFVQENGSKFLEMRLPHAFTNPNGTFQ